MNNRLISYQNICIINHFFYTEHNKNETRSERQTDNTPEDAVQYWEAGTFNELMEKEDGNPFSNMSAIQT